MPSAPMSSACLISTWSFHATRTMGTVGEPLKAIRQFWKLSLLKPPCSVSMNTQSKPAPAMISAMVGLATVSQAPKVVSPCLRRAFNLLLRSDMNDPCELAQPEFAQIGSRALGDGQRLVEGGWE